MASEAKARRRAKLDAAALRAASEADAAGRLECAEVERRAILTDATQRASVILHEAELEAADEATRLRDEAHHDAKRIREEAVEEVLKLMSALTTERDHILADARDDARQIRDAAREERESTLREPEPPRDGAGTGSTPDSSAAVDHDASRTELDELFFPGAPEPAPPAPRRVLVVRQRRKRLLSRR